MHRRVGFDLGIADRHRGRAGADQVQQRRAAFRSGRGGDRDAAGGVKVRRALELDVGGALAVHIGPGQTQQQPGQNAPRRALVEQLGGDDAERRPWRWRCP